MFELLRCDQRIPLIFVFFWWVDEEVEEPELALVVICDDEVELDECER